SIDSVTYPGFPIISAEIDHQFTDVPGDINYYMINAVVEVLDTISSSTDFYELARSIQNDNNRDGQLIRGGLTTGSNFFGDIIGMRLFLSTGNFDYYEYHRTILNGNNSGDPFSEPALVHSNVTNGYGIFSGIQTSSVFIPL
ncbi:MAG: DUF4249 family protein, partial [Bacteroidia bacterium]